MIFSTNSIAIKRFDAGFSFVEEYPDNRRYNYKVISRECIGNAILEILEPINELVLSDYSLICESQYYLDPVPLRGDSADSFSLWQLETQKMIVIQELEQKEDLPEWLQMETGNLYTSLKQIKLYAQKVSSNQADLSQPKLQHPKPREVSPLQKLQHPQPFDETNRDQTRREKKVSNPKLVEAQSQQLSQPALVSPIPKGVQVGLLCPPVFLPDGQSLRKSPPHRKEYQKRSSQVHSLDLSQCLIQT